VATAEPTETPVGRRLAEMVTTAPADHHTVEPETAALLSAADRAEHVATLIRPALERGEVVVCDRYVLTSLAVHGGARGADIDRIRSVNAWSTGELMPDLTLVVECPSGPASTDGEADVEVAGAANTLLEAADADPERCVLCPPELPEVLPDAVLERLRRLADTRASLLVTVPAGPEPAPGEIPAR
jgi:dTMP kinase